MGCFVGLGLVFCGLFLVRLIVVMIIDVLSVVQFILCFLLEVIIKYMNLTISIVFLLCLEFLEFMYF
jgi:hypothetical protein